MVPFASIAADDLAQRGLPGPGAVAGHGDPASGGDGGAPGCGGRGGGRRRLRGPLRRRRAVAAGAIGGPARRARPRVGRQHAQRRDGAAGAQGGPAHARAPAR